MEEVEEENLRQKIDTKSAKILFATEVFHFETYAKNNQPSINLENSIGLTLNSRNWPYEMWSTSKGGCWKNCITLKDATNPPRGQASPRISTRSPPFPALSEAVLDVPFQECLQLVVVAASMDSKLLLLSLNGLKAFTFHGPLDFRKEPEIVWSQIQWMRRLRVYCEAFMSWPLCSMAVSRNFTTFLIIPHT